MTNSISFFKRHKEPIRNIVLVIVMVTAAFILLTVQGLVHFSAPDFKRVTAAVDQNFDGAAMVKADEAELRKNFGFNARDLENFVYYAPRSAMDASEILILEVKNEAQLESCLRAAQARRATRIDTFKNYRPQQAEILGKSELKVQGKYLIFISSEKVSEIKKAVELSFR